MTGALAKAAEYEAKAWRMASGEDRAAYLELARAEREQAALQGDGGAGAVALAKSPAAGYPAIDVLVAKASAARSVATALLAMADEGRLGELEADIARMRAAAGSGAQFARRKIA